jgi:DNA-binding transcriptional LysR family regulator
MEIRHLRYFVAVADELSFTRAAAHLHVAQSAVSSQIQDLENEVGVALLERSSRQVELTMAGKTFLEDARQLLQNLEVAVKQARRIGKAGYGVLGVGFIGAQSHEWMPSVLRRFRQKYPGVEVSLSEMVASQQLEALLARKLDVGLIGPIEGKPPPGLVYQCIAEEAPVVAVSSDHRFAGVPELELEMVKDEPFVLTSRDNSPNYRAWILRICQEAGFTPNVVHEVDRARTGVQYVAAGFGISIFAEHVSRVPMPGVVFIPLRYSGTKIRFGVAWRRGNTDELVSRFISYMTVGLSPLESEPVMSGYPHPIAKG